MGNIQVRIPIRKQEISYAKGAGVIFCHDLPDVGGVGDNQKLSQRRAEGVKNYMVKTFGIDASRLSAKGYGMTRPIESNKTAAWRQKNRRVEPAADYTIKKK